MISPQRSLISSALGICLRRKKPPSRGARRASRGPNGRIRYPRGMVAEFLELLALVLRVGHGVGDHVDQFALAALELVAHRDLVRHRAAIDVGLERIDVIATLEPRRTVGEFPVDGETFSLQLLQQPIRNEAVHAIVVEDRSPLDCFDPHLGVFRRVDQPVFWREEGSVEAADGIVAGRQQLEAVCQRLKMPDTPFRRAEAFSGDAEGSDCLCRSA